MGVCGETFILVISLASFLIFLKQFLEYMMREKTILNKLLNFQKNNVCAVGQRLHSPGNDYLLINKYKVCSDKSRNSLLRHVVFITAGYGSKMWETMLNINLLFRLFLYISN